MFKVSLSWWRYIKIIANILKYTRSIRLLTFTVLNLGKLLSIMIRNSGQYRFNYDNYGDDMLSAVYCVEENVDVFYERNYKFTKGFDKNLRRLIVKIESCESIFERSYYDKEGYGVGTIVEIKNIFKSL